MENTTMKMKPNNNRALDSVFIEDIQKWQNTLHWYEHQYWLLGLRWDFCVSVVHIKLVLCCKGGMIKYFPIKGDEGL